ncbi:MAG: protein-disulfide isomerase [Desulfuromonas sp.]|nr:MAG: protein-disulfide isomerase [Desulfuromonas sp.]
MIRWLIFCCLSLFTSATLSMAAADNPPGGVAAALGMNFPNIQPQRIAPTPVPGLYEILLPNEEILYFNPQSGHLIAGEIWTKDARNLTRESKAELMTAKIGMFPLEKAIKIGNGPNQVIEVVDPDCPFCREGSAFFAGRDDVTRYVFLLPLERIHPNVTEKARYILSAEDPILAYEEAMGGRFDNEPVPEFKDNGLLDEHLEIARKVGLNGTPKFWINGKFVSGNNLDAIKKLLTLTK